MKLLMTTDTIGGVWNYCMDLCAALEDAGVSIALASMGRPVSADQYEQLVSLPHVELFESHYRLCWMEDPWDDVEQAGEWLLSLERDFQPDIIHLNDLAHGNLEWKAPVLIVGHSCVLSWWEAVKKQAAPAQWQTYRNRVRESLQAADLVVAPTHAMLAGLVWHYGSAKASMVIANGHDFPALGASPLQLVPQPIIFSAGRVWDEAKNMGALAEIAPSLPWPVYVAGEQTDPNGGIADMPDVQCLGMLNRDQLEDWLLKTAIYVAPAYYEPFGLSILEAARAGCALVLGDIPSLREVWGETADYVDPEDHQQLRQVVLSLIDNPSRRQNMAERAWHRAQIYSAAHMASEYLACYQALGTGTLPAHLSFKTQAGVSL